MTAVLGIDTSNYTTSAAVLKQPGGLFEQRRLLEVGAGEKGLRQSEALFQHVKHLPALLEALPGLTELRAVGASVKPRDAEGSYMPCFLAGEGAARAVAAVSGVSFFAFSHQAGHIAAALYSLGRLELLGKPLLAFHVSGGTTEAVLVRPSDETVIEGSIVAQSIDLKAGQAVDRVGVMLGLQFPCGPALEQLAKKSARSFHMRPCFKGLDFSLSGVENQCRAMLERGEPHEDVAAYCLAFIGAVLEQAAMLLTCEYPGLPLVFAGGVMSNEAIRTGILRRFDALFAAPGFSSDNAAGIAALAMRKAGVA